MNKLFEKKIGEQYLESRLFQKLMRWQFDCFNFQKHLAMMYPLQFLPMAIRAAHHKSIHKPNIDSASCCILIYKR